MRRLTRLARLGGLGIATVLVVAACGSSESASQQSGSSTSGDSGAAGAQSVVKKSQQKITSWPGVHSISNPVDLSGKKVEIVPFAGTSAILAGMAKAGQGALEHMGANVSICDGQGNPTQLASCLQQGLSDHAFAVVTEFASYMMVPNVYDQLANAGVNVLIVGDSAVPGKTYPKNIQFLDFGKSFVEVAKLQADAAVADFGSKADVVVLEQTDTPNEVEMGQAVVDELKARCPGCGSKVVKFTRANADKLASQVSAALVTEPNANVISVPVDSWVGAARQGIQSAGKTAGVGGGHVEIVSTGSDLASLQLVDAGIQAHDFGSSALFDGYLVADGVVTEASGGTVPPVPTVTRDFVKSNVSKLTLTAAAYQSADWFGNDTFKEAFYAAWGSK